MHPRPARRTRFQVFSTRYTLKFTDKGAAVLVAEPKPDAADPADPAVLNTSEPMAMECASTETLAECSGPEGLGSERPAGDPAPDIADDATGSAVKRSPLREGLAFAEGAGAAAADAAA